jgi:tellurite methyltransferase
MIPINNYKYKESPIWDNNSIPEKLLVKHNTKQDVYAKINIIKWELEYTIFSDDLAIKSQEIINSSHPWIISPQQWHKITPLWDVEIFIEFYKTKPEYIIKREAPFKLKYGKSPHKEVQELLELMKDSKNKKTLDIWCGLWRNSIFLAEHWFKVEAIDRNIDALTQINEISNKNGLSIVISWVDLNSYTITWKYDCIYTTVVLQFLEKDSAVSIINSMQHSTNDWWYNIIIVPIDSIDHNCPIRFPTLFQSWDIKSFYKSWEIIEYNEMLWTFHRKDQFWNKVIARFATIIAKK